MEFEGLCILTNDVPRLARFYCDLFETVSAGNDLHTTMKIGGLGLAIWKEDGVGYPDEKALHDLRRHCYALMFASPDVERTFQRAQALGAVIQEPPADQPWGVRAFVLNDPDGNRIDIVGKPQEIRNGKAGYLK
jgi:predicted enzyme related to lactoylglutathione lyase